MSESMIERVARAIMKRRFYDCEPDMYGNDLDLFFKQVDPDHCIDALDEARAAIEAMRDPTDAMVDAASGAGLCPSGVSDIYIDMIETALSEQVSG